MSRFIVLLRGVNVGKRNRVPMLELRRVLESLGYTDVRTVLNSGNAVFSSRSRKSESIAIAIRDALAEQLDLRVPVVVKSETELSAIVRGNTLALASRDPSRLLVAFAPNSAALKSLSGIRALTQSPDEFAVGSHAAYLHCPRGILQSAPAAALLGRLGREVTTRNWATVLRMNALLAAPPP